MVRKIELEFGNSRFNMVAIKQMFAGQCFHLPGKGAGWVCAALHAEASALWRRTFPSKGLGRFCLLYCVIGFFSGLSLLAQPTEQFYEGTVTSAQIVSNWDLLVELDLATNLLFLEIPKPGGLAPRLHSRVRVVGEVQREQASGQLKMKLSGLDKLQFLTGIPLPLVDTIAGLRHMGALGQHVAGVARLTGLVLGANPARTTFALQDETGAALLEMKTPEAGLIPGQKVILEGNCLVEGNWVLLRDPPVVDNNDIHKLLERSGAIYLSAGKHPLKLSWFNLELPYGLEVYYEGPGIARQLVPGSILYHRKSGRFGADGDWLNGLDYRVYGGTWLRVPDFDRLTPFQTGTAGDFGLGMLTDVENVGLQLSGSIEVPLAGVYTFSTRSDDGSLLYIDEHPPAFQVLGTNAVPEPTPIAVRQNLSADQDARWSEAEGTITFTSEQAGSLELELSGDTGRMRVQVVDGTGGSPQMLLNSRVRVTGVCLVGRTSEGAEVASELLAPGMEQVEMLTLPPERWSEQPLISPSKLAGMRPAPGGETLVRVRGQLTKKLEGGLQLEDGLTKVPVFLAQSPPPVGDGPVEVLGRLAGPQDMPKLECAFCQEIAGKPKEGPPPLPLLGTVEQIKRLTRDEWERGYPVKIRGVITTLVDSGFFIQDSTRSIYARWRSPTDYDVPRMGELWEIEGATFAEFAPNIRVTKATRLGLGTLPEPLHPTPDQLSNGSLDTEYVEVQGAVTSIMGDEITLLTRGGNIWLQLPDVPRDELRHLEDALVRVRGCVVPVRDIHTQEVVPGRMSFLNASINVDEAAPADPFAIRLKHASDLLLFDLRGGAFQRVKIAGQIVHQRGRQLFLLDNGTGLRVIPKTNEVWQAGDLVETVGFPDFSSPSPMLREAVVHRTGHGSLPEPVRLPPGAAPSRKYDGALVRAQARLVTFSRDHAEQVLELQDGTRGFVARVEADPRSLGEILTGSLLELTGVYSGQGGDPASGVEFTSFEMLLNNADDVRVLARASWWTIRHTLTVLGGMALAIFVASVWIALLRREVAERTSQLAEEIRRHEFTERQRELEEERARIARDLHDDLGATLTQIRFLSALESRDAQLPEATRNRMKQVSEKSHEMVASLDEIVWAVNPANDLVPSLANYLCHFAEEFFRPTEIRCRLDVQDNLPPVSLTSEVRHNLYLAVREALNNIAKHSGATEVWFRVHFLAPNQLTILMEDNGHGFSSLDGEAAGNGLTNMRRRMKSVGGTFEYENRLSGGVLCRLILPITTAGAKVV